MKINEIYNKYKIPEILRKHMYMVASVASVVCDHLDKNININKDLVVKTALIHDLGNLVKFYLVDDSFVEEEEREILKESKDEFLLKYGEEEHLATNNMLREINVSKEVIDLYNNLGSSKIPQTIELNDWNRKICSYSDFRVAPHGVESVTARFDEIIERYNGKNHVLADVEKTEQKKNSALILENQIQEKCNIDLSLINNEFIKERMIELKEYAIV